MYRLPSLQEIEICNRLIYNEIGPILSHSIEESAIALVCALLNLSKETNLSLAMLLTGQEEPKEKDFCVKNVMFLNGRLSFISTIKSSPHDYTGLITEIFSGVIRDPLYGAFRFFNYIEDEYPQCHRQQWNIGENTEIKTGIVYGKFEYDPSYFLKAKEEGNVDFNHLEHWEKQKRFMI